MVQVAVDDLAATLESPVLIEDSGHQPLWWSAQDAVDGTRIRSILQRSVAPAAVAMVAKMGLPRATGPVRTPAVPEAEMLARWCVPLRVGPRLLGYLWVLDRDGRVTEADLPPAVACAAQAAAVLAANVIVEDDRSHRRAALLQRLAKAPDREAVRDLMELERLAPGTLIVVQSPRRPGGWDLSTDQSVHVVGTADQGATSGKPVPLGDLHVAVARAAVTQRALRAGASLESPSWDALGAWRLIAAAPDDLTAADVHPGVSVLSELSRSDLLATAWTVLELGGDVTRSAAELHIHRTTLYYRLDRIAALTGVDLRTGLERIDLHLALRLAAYRRAAE